MFTVQSAEYSYLGSEPFVKLYQLVTCGNDHYVKLWEVAVVRSKFEGQPSTGKINLCRIMERHSSALTCVCFNSNGSCVASSGLDKTAVIWETVNKERYSCPFLPYSACRLFPVFQSSGKVMTIISGHNRYVACCAFSRGGNLLATGNSSRKPCCALLCISDPPSCNDVFI